LAHEHRAVARIYICDVARHGGKDAALIELRNDPGADPDTIKMVEDWPAGLRADGRSQPLTIEEWQAQHWVGEADKSVH
jgi:hypothetical protein